MLRPPPSPDPGLIGLSVANPNDLFHAFDPSPMVGRDLDDEVEQYILESALEAPQTRYQLVIHAPEDKIGLAETAQIPDAIRQYFLYKLEVYQRHLRIRMLDGRRSLFTGLLFLAICWGLGMVAMNQIPEPYGDFFREGLLIIGWVANWKPIEFFLYDRRPMVRQRNVLKALSEMAISIRHADQNTKTAAAVRPQDRMR